MASALPETCLSSPFHVNLFFKDLSDKMNKKTLLKGVLHFVQDKLSAADLNHLRS